MTPRATETGWAVDVDHEVLRIRQHVEELRNSLLHLRDRVQKLEEQGRDAKGCPADPNPLPPFKPGLYVVGEFEECLLGVYVTSGNWGGFRHVRVDTSDDMWIDCPVLEVWDEGRLVWEKR